MSQERLPKKILHCVSWERRKRGRPRHGWRDDVDGNAVQEPSGEGHLQPQNREIRSGETSRDVMKSGLKYKKKF